MALCAPNYGHVEQLWHRHVRAKSISQKPNEEQILAAKVDLSQVKKLNERRDPSRLAMTAKLAFKRSNIARLSTGVMCEVLYQREFKALYYLAQIRVFQHGSSHCGPNAMSS